MNLNSLPTQEELKDLISACNDNAGNHMLWVNNQGEVNISTITNGLTPVGFETSQPTMSLRYETFGEGNDYVGENAAQDNSHVSRLFKSLVAQWPEAKKNSNVTYVDVF